MHDQPDQRAVGKGRCRSLPRAVHQPRRVGLYAELLLQRRQQRLHGKGIGPHLHHTGFQPRIVEQGGQHLGRRARGGMGMPQHGELVVVERAALQRFEEQAHRVQGLAQVVAGSGQETGFVAVGLLGGLLGREGALRFGAQLVHQPVVFQLERNAAPCGPVGGARLHARERVVDTGEKQRGPHHRPASQRHRHHHAADGTGEVGDIGAVQRGPQPESARRHRADDADGVDDTFRGAPVEHHIPQAAPAQPHGGHAGDQFARRLLRRVGERRNAAQREVHPGHHECVGHQPHRDGLGLGHPRHDPQRAERGGQRCEQRHRKVVPQQGHLLAQHLIALPRRPSPAGGGLGGIRLHRQGLRGSHGAGGWTGRGAGPPARRRCDC
ncbi:hypothetical protein D3C71_1208020 [compost metagenome]